MLMRFPQVGWSGGSLTRCDSTDTLDRMITLFTSPTGNGHRVSILLEELGLDYQVVKIGFEPGAPRPPEFVAASPFGKIPAIIDHDGPDGAPVMLCESLAIAQYLVEKTGRLLPATAEGRARAAEWGAIVVTGFASPFAGIFFARRIDAEAHAGLITKYFADLDIAFAALEGRLAASPYLAGDDLSYADALAIPIVNTAKMFEIDLTPYPAIRRWRDLVLARPAIQAGFAVP